MTEAKKQPFYKIIRILTLAPLLASVVLTVMFFTHPAEIDGLSGYLIAQAFLLLCPVLAYPVQWLIPPLRRLGRNFQRNAAILAALLGYVAGTVWSFVRHSSHWLMSVFLAYLLSALCIALTTVLHFKASAHACGVVGPVAILTYYVSPFALLGLMLLVPVFVASVRMKRNTVPQLVVGSLIPVGTFAFSAFLVSLL